MTAQEDFQAFLDAQKVEGYILGNITGTPEGDMRQYTELKVSAAQEAEKIKLFSEARSAKFEEMRQRHDLELQALGVEWQEYENQGYVIPQ